MFRPLFAGVRARKIKSRRELAQAEAHGRRTDSSSRRRIVPERAGCQIVDSRLCPSDPLDIQAAYRARLAETDAAIVNGRAIAMHMIFFVTSDVIREAGGVHDPANPTNRILIAEATAFCERVFGEGSVIATRMDLDEEGCGAVDVFVVPIERLAVNQYSSRSAVSIEQPLRRLQMSYGAERSFAALQTAWALHAKERIDGRLQRGIPKETTGRLHVYADTFRKTVEFAEVSALESLEAARLRHRQEIEVESTRLKAEAVAAAEKEAAEILEAARTQAAWEREEGLARLRAQEQEAYAKATRERAALQRGRTALIAEMQRVADASASIERDVGERVDQALRALSAGLVAYEQGLIVGISEDEETSRTKFFGSPDLTPIERSRLRAELLPGWPAGLASALRVVHMARDAASRGLYGPESFSAPESVRAGW